MIKIGERSLNAPLLKPFFSILLLLFSLKDQYRFIYTGGGPGSQMFTSMQPSFLDKGGNRIELRLTMDPGFEPCREFFISTKGFLSTLPEYMGLGRSIVNIEIVPNGVVYDVTLPPSGTVARWRKVFSIFSFFSAATSSARELKEAHESLHQRFEEVQKANAEMAHQARQLRTAHDISSAVHGELDLDASLQSVTRALVDAAGYAAVEVIVKADVEGTQIARQVKMGADIGRTPLPECKLTSQGRDIGKITVWPGAMAQREAEQMLDFCLPTIALALDNALSVTGLKNYRANLEKMVVTRTAELSDAREQLERSLESRNQFFSNVNHDLRSPLMAMLLVIQRISLNPHLGEDAKRSLDQARANAQRMKDLVEDLLALASGTEGRRVEVSNVSAESLLNHIASALRPVAESKNLSLSVDIEPGLEFDANAKQLERAFSNLADNALKYTEQGSVTLQAKTDGTDVRLSVIDTGPGIPKDYLDKVFERFVQVPRAKASPGVGIGLALVREIANQHGGTVGLESEVGKGSTFFIRFPKRAGAVLKKPEAKPEVVTFDANVPKAKAQGPLFPYPAQLLICEDDPGLAQQLTDFFSENGLKVRRAANGEEALELAKKFPPDLLLTDVDLGAGIDGLELCRRFRAMPEHRNAAALVLTADTRREVVTAMEAGAVDFLRKPVDLFELAARVRAQLAYRDMAKRLLTSEKLAGHAAALTGLAHELRNPLNGLINAVQPLKMMIPATPEMQTAQELLTVIEDCGRRVAGLARDLLSYTPNHQVEQHPVAVANIVNQALTVMKSKVQEVELKTDLRCRGMVMGSGDQLSQIIMNLIENAIHAAGPKGTITIETVQDGEDVLLDICDSGPGIPSELQDKVFEPFFTTKAAGEGTGLGLAISRDIARRHHGDLSIRPTKPFGMRLKLPILMESLNAAR